MKQYYEGSTAILLLLTKLGKKANGGKTPYAVTLENGKLYRLDLFLRGSVETIKVSVYEELVTKFCEKIQILDLTKILVDMPDNTKRDPWFKFAAKQVKKDELKEFVMLAIRDILV